VTVGRPQHLPFTGDGSRLRMGLRPLREEDWLEIDEDLDLFVAHKQRMLSERPADVVAVVADSDGSVHSASVELLECLAGHLVRWHSSTHVPAGDGIAVGSRGDVVPVTPSALAAAGLHPIDAAGQLTQEDWTIQVRRPDGWILAAASVCCPTRWVLAEKLGRPMADVHRPVAGYTEQLESAVDRFFDRITPEEPRWRLNWNLTDSTDLYQPGGKYRDEPDAGLTADVVADRVWLRVERQTLRRLPRSGAVVFGIRIHSDPLGVLADRPDVLARLAATIRSLPPGTLSHKSMGAFAPAVLSWIDGTVAGRQPGNR